MNGKGHESQSAILIPKMVEIRQKLKRKLLKFSERNYLNIQVQPLKTFREREMDFNEKTDLDSLLEAFDWIESTDWTKQSDSQTDRQTERLKYIKPGRMEPMQTFEIKFVA